jgi:serine/threonine protein kinase
MDRYVAIKVLPEQMSLNTEICKRFDREAKVIAKLTHAHILPVHDYGMASNRLYIVMRYVEAGTLKDRIAAGSMDLDELNHIMQQVGGALAYAHRLGVIHRDVKPGNVLLDAQGDCYLTDFGLARIMEASVQLTASGVGIGTPAYMSPEQGEGSKADSRSDIYSLGVMLYEMVTGQVPYQAETPMAVVLKHITAPLPLPRSVKPDVPEGIERVILKAMAKDPGHRFQTVDEMLSALRAAVQLAGAEAVIETAVSAPTPLETVVPPTEGLLARAVAHVREAIQTGWGRMATWAAAGIIVLLILSLVWTLLPFEVQIRDGQLVVGRAETVTATLEATMAVTPTEATVARTTSTPTPASSSTPTPRPTATSTPTSTPTHTPAPTNTHIPTRTPTPRPTTTPTHSPTITPSPTPRPTATATPIPVDAQALAFADPILSAIAGRPPDFEDDFSTADKGWDLHVHGESGPQDRLEIVDGLVRMTLFDGALGVLNHGGLTFKSFVLEFDYRLVGGGEGSRQSFNLRIPDGHIGLTIWSGSGTWSLRKSQGAQESYWYDIPYGVRNIVSPTGEMTRVVIVARGPQLAVYLNDVPLAYVRDQVLDVSHDTWFNCDGLPNAVCEFDNVRAWNLENVPGLLSEN